MNIEPSWEVFDECDDCFAGPKMPCYNIRDRSKNLKPMQNPHRRRKRLPKDAKQ